VIVNNFSMGVSVTGRELNSRLCFNETFYERVVRVGVFVGELWFFSMGVFVRNILATIALRLVLGRVYLPQILR
jgi:hypothetical protein